MCHAIIAVAITCSAGRMARVGVLGGSFCCKYVAIGVLLIFDMHVVAWMLHSTAEYYSCDSDEVLCKHGCVLPVLSSIQCNSSNAKGEMQNTLPLCPIC